LGIRGSVKVFPAARLPSHRNGRDGESETGSSGIYCDTGTDHAACHRKPNQMRPSGGRRGVGQGAYWLVEHWAKASRSVVEFDGDRVNAGSSPLVELAARRMVLTAIATAFEPKIRRVTSLPSHSCDPEKGALLCIRDRAPGIGRPSKCTSPFTAPPSQQFPPVKISFATSCQNNLQPPSLFVCVEPKPQPRVPSMSTVRSPSRYAIRSKPGRRVPMFSGSQPRLRQTLFVSRIPDANAAFPLGKSIRYEDGPDGRGRRLVLNYRLDRPP